MMMTIEMTVAKMGRSTKKRDIKTSSNRPLNNTPFTLRQAQGERRDLENLEDFPFVLSSSKHKSHFLSPVNAPTPSLAQRLAASLRSPVASLLRVHRGPRPPCAAESRSSRAAPAGCRS